MKRSLLALAFALTYGLSGGAALAQNAPAIQEDPTVTRRALEWVVRFQNGNIDRSQLDAAINAKLTPPELAAMRKQLVPFGAPTGIGYGGARIVNNNRVYRYVVVFPVGAIQEFLSLDRTGKIDGLLFLPVH